MAYDDKENERWCVERFLRARKSATGEALSLVSDSEAPDFICRRPNGEVVGVEHTRILYNPERDEIRQYLGTYDPDSDNFQVLWGSAVALAKKEAKRRKPHWKYPDSTILVLDLIGHTRIESWPEDDTLSDDFKDSGFIEVWISDHSSIETHGEVMAIGLFPKERWGIQGQGYLWAPPYR
jgi:hypothetical protein